MNFDANLIIEGTRISKDISAQDDDTAAAGDLGIEPENSDYGRYTLLHLDRTLFSQHARLKPH